jgi:glycosyltransferase involved in cell wall biosynthesis
MDEVINGLDIIALSSKNEGTPVSLIEAQAAGKVVVSTNVGGVNDICLSTACLLSDNNNKFIINLLESIESIETLSKISKEKSHDIIEAFSHFKLAERTENLYRLLLKSKEK